MSTAAKFIFILLLFTLVIFAQGSNKLTIKGRVLDKETGAPLEYVNVFLSNTTIGTSTDKRGQFIVKNVPFGSYSIIFSYVGYEIVKRDFNSYQTETINYNISLKPKAINLQQINVTGHISEDWKDNLKIFTRIFLGETDNSKETKLLNPEVLNFVKDKKTNALKAYADSVVVVENKALGYKLFVYLDSVVYMPERFVKYMFYPKFEELVPFSEKEKLVWESNRQKTYLDSPKHFFYALVHKQLDKDFYSLSEGSGTMSKIFPEELSLTSNSDSSIYTLNFMGSLAVRSFLGSKSYLNFLYSFVLIDKYGNLLNSSYAVEKSGYWAQQRVADLLPENYVYLGN